MQFFTDLAGAGPRRVASLATALLALGACASVPTQSASMMASPDLVASATRLQVRSFELGRTLSMLIVQASDSILAVATNPEVQRAALLWKISGVPLVQEAALRVDPLVAGVDLLALTMQQLDYLTTGSGRDVFGPQQAIAVAAAKECVRRADGASRASVRDSTLKPTFEVGLQEWVANHPMHGPTLTRPSILDSDWDALGLSAQTLQATIGHVDRVLVNITYRLSYLNETLGAQARWNAELAVLLAMGSPRADSIFGIGAATLGTVGSFLDSTPSLLDHQREALMSEVDRQRILAFQDIATIEDALTAERTALILQVGQEREAAFLAADSMVARALVQSEEALRRLALEMIVGALVVVAALLGSGVLLINRWRATAA